MRHVSRYVVQGVCIFALCQGVALGIDFVPWTEVNAWVNYGSTSDRYYNNALEGISYWAQVTDTVCITTRAELDTNNIDVDLQDTVSKIQNLYDRLDSDMDTSLPPGVTEPAIIPGIKTNNFFKTTEEYEPGKKIYRLDKSIQAWTDLRDALDAIYQETGSTTIVVENEGCNTHLRVGHYTPVEDTPDEGWDLIDQGLEIIGEWAGEDNGQWKLEPVTVVWYPGVCGSPTGVYPTERDIVKKLVIDYVCPNIQDVELVPVKWYYKQASGVPDPTELCGNYHMICQFDKSVHSRSHTNCWLANDIPNLKDNCPGDDYFFPYPGMTSWIISGLEATQVLNDPILVSAESVMTHAAQGELGIQIYPDTGSVCDPRINGTSQQKFNLTFSGPVTTISVQAQHKYQSTPDTAAVTLQQDANGYYTKAEAVFPNAFTNERSYSISISGDVTDCFIMNVLYGNVIDHGTSRNKVDNMDYAAIKTFNDELVNKANCRFDVHIQGPGNSMIMAYDHFWVNDEYGSEILSADFAECK